jgi:hypothetical protein
MQWRVMLTLSAIALGLGTIAIPAAAAELKDVTNASQKNLDAQVASQKRVDTFSDQKGDISDRYRATLRDSQSLRLYVLQLKQQIQSQHQEMDAIVEETRSLERTSVEILPLMQKMLDTLDQFVAMDVPFQLSNRKDRLEKLKEMMPRADVTVSEKYRKIIEAYQLEVDYGRTIEAYEGPLNGKTVDFLRVGRISLMYQTSDGKETGYWDNTKRQWTIDGSYADGVAEGLKIAKKQTSPDLLLIPVLAAAHGGPSS